MLDQQIESAASKLVQFIQDLTENVRRFLSTSNNNDAQFQDLFQLRSDYARQLAALFDLLIHHLLQDFRQHQSTALKFHFDPVQLWRAIQVPIEQLSQCPTQDTSILLKHMRNINNNFYNLLCHLKNCEFLKVDPIRIFSESLSNQLNCLADTLHQFPTKCTTTKPTEAIKPVACLDTYLFQSSPTQQCSNNNSYNQLQQQQAHMNPCQMRTPCSHHFARETTVLPINTMRCHTESVPLTNLCPPAMNLCKPMGCALGSAKPEQTPPLCFPTPVVYTPEMETLFSSGGIIYARKSGNTWIAENLGTLIETLKEIGENLDLAEHCEILVRKTGDLLVRRKRGRRKRMLQDNLQKSTPRGHNTYDQQYTSDSSVSHQNRNEQ